MEPAKAALGDEETDPLIKKLIQTLITALENHNANSKSEVRSRSSSSANSRSGRGSVNNDDIKSSNREEQSSSSLESSKITVREEVVIESFKNRVGRMPQYGNGQWMTQKLWEVRMPIQNMGPSTSSESLAVLFQFHKNKKWLCILSPSLVAAYQKVNKHPRLSMGQHPTKIIESDPCPTLFYHLEDMRSEIESSGDESAKLDFEALEFISKEFEQRWQDAREENFDDGLCNYGILWRLFNPGDLVVRRDELGNEWLLVLIELKEHSEIRPNQEPPVEYTEFVTWGLSFSTIDSVLVRRVLRFRLYPFTDRHRIASLPVYPLDQKGEKEAFVKKCSERGRKWQALMATTPTCVVHDGFAMSEAAFHNIDETKNQDVKGIHRVSYFLNTHFH